jgi:hypothetical protein
MLSFKWFFLVGILAMGVGVVGSPEQANAACLAFNDDGQNAYWQNTCNFTVSVNWTSSSSVCSGWSCSDVVGGGQRSSINQNQGHVEWRECRGSSCEPSCSDARNC